MMLRRTSRTGSLRRRAALTAPPHAEDRDVRRDVHDALGPTLVGAALLAKSLASAVPDGLREPALRLVALLNDATAEARRVAQGSLPASADLPRELASLTTLCAEVMGVECRLHGAGVEAIAQEGDGLEVLLLVREAVTNAVRHGGARRVDVTVHAEGALRTVIVGDDGRGFDRVEGPGVGLASMEARARRLGGRLTVEAASPSGVEVRCTFPAPAAREARS